MSSSAMSQFSLPQSHLRSKMPRLQIKRRGIHPPPWQYDNHETCVNRLISATTSEPAVSQHFGVPKPRSELVLARSDARRSTALIRVKIVSAFTGQSWQTGSARNWNLHTSSSSKFF